MGLRVQFDVNHNPIPPTIVLANRNGNKLGVIDNYYGLQLGDVFSDNPQMSFKVTKKDNESITRLWSDIVDFKLVWCKEWDFWFQISVDLDDSNETIKSIDCTPLCQAELGQIMLYDIQINTEDDIARDDYDEPTVVYNPENVSASLLNRIKEKAPHYSVSHVDSTIASIQRTFEFDNESIQDALNSIGTEIDCLVVYDNGSIDDPNGVLGKIPARSFSLYDLENNCSSCGYRGEFTDICPECGSTDIITGYGNDTTIFVTKDNLTEEVNYSCDTDSVKNCFHLVGGDDLMTATIRNCNPNGTGYIWYISDEQKEDMRPELVQKLEAYDNLYTYYDEEYNCEVSASLITAYNNLIAKYLAYNSDLEQMPSSVIGYSALMNGIYDTIDFELYLNDALMPTVATANTNAIEQASFLTAQNLSPCAVLNYSTISATTVDNNILSVARILVQSTYQVKIKSSSYNSSTHVWTGNFTITNYSDDTDTADSATISVTITDNYEQFIKQKLDKALNTNEAENYDITSLFKKNIVIDNNNNFVGEFVSELKKYSLVSLNTFHECCQSCIDILVEQGVSDLNTWGNSTPNLYKEFYLDYLYKLKAIEAETAIRESEIQIIQNLEDELEEKRLIIQNALNFQDYLGTTLWKEFCAYRRDDEYSNTNYISDGLSNTELFQNAREFLETAKKELFKSATLQHQISSTLKNLLVIPEFEKLLDYFEVGNWIRIEVDGKIYKLRLIQYSIDFDDLSKIDVDFSDVLTVADGRTDVKSILSKASSMASSYAAVERQATKGEKTFKKLDDWSKYGLATTLTKILNDADHQDMTWDSHGMLFRKYDDITDSYFDEQLKIINSTIAITDDAWETTKTAIGKFYYKNPKTGNLEIAYGVNGEVIVGKMLIGETLGIYNSSATLSFDEDGLMITNGINTFVVNPNNTTRLLQLSNATEDVLYVDANGNLVANGDIVAKTLSAGGKTSQLSRHSGLFIDSDGNLYSGTENQTQIYSDGRFSFGNGNLTWDNTTLVANGTVYATAGAFGRTNPFTIGDSGFEGSRTTGSTNFSNLVTSRDLRSGNSFSNSFDLTFSKTGSGTDNDITLTLNNLELTVQYSYSVTRTIDTSQIIDEYSEITDTDEDGTTYETGGDTSSSESSGTTTTTTTTISDVVAATILSSNLDVSNSVVITNSGSNKVYTYTYSISTSDIVAYLQNLIKDAVQNNVRETFDDNSIIVNASNITITGAIFTIIYSYGFTSTDIYTHIGTDYLSYSNIFSVRNGVITLGNPTVNGELKVSSNVYVGANSFIRGSMASNDYWRLLGGGSNDAGYLEIATADNGTEPIYIRQYTGVFATLKRTLTLLDGNGNTTLPGILNVRYLKSTATYIDFNSQVVFTGADTWLGYSSATGERRLRFAGTTAGTYRHNTYLYGGNTGSKTALGVYDGKNNRSVWYYDDVENIMYVNTAIFYFKDWGGTVRKPVASITGNKNRVQVFGSKASGLSVSAQWGGTSYSTRSISVSSSDIRLKENISDCEIDSALDVLNMIKIRSFDWKNNEYSHQKIGFVADELETIDTRFSVGGGMDSEGRMNIKCVDSFYMLGYVVKAIQELSEENKKLKERIKKLEAVA